MSIIGEINDGITMDILQNLEETKWTGIKEIHLHISSSGGYLADTFAIIDLFQKAKKEHNLIIYTYGLGDVASAGFFLFILGDKRYLYPSGRIFVHSHVIKGNDEKTYEERLRDDKTEEKIVYNNYTQYTAERLEIPIGRARGLLKKKKWLTKKELLDYNIITKEQL
jgi:ATP-dependent protease ClpP protease subunit